MIPFAQPQIGKDEIDAVTRVMRTGWIARGAETEAFEKEFASYVGAKHAVFTNGCTSALKIALRVLGVRRVAVPSFTFTATAAAVVETGGEPVFADINPRTFCLNPKTVPLVDAVIPVHYGGVEAPTAYLPPVIVDSAHLIKKGGFDKSVKAQCYSFYASKTMTTGAGGMLVTNDSELYQRARLLNNDGIDRSSLERYSGLGYLVQVPGGGYDGTDLAAAIGRVQLRRLPEFEAKRSELVSIYNNILGEKRTGNYLYPILVNNRVEFISKMRDDGITTSIFYLPLHQMPAYQDSLHGDLSITEEVGKRVVCLPLHPGLTQKEAVYIATMAKEYRK